MKTYSELIKLPSYAERLNYLMTYSNNPGNEEREVMNRFYKSDIWIDIRKKVIFRDWGNDMGLDGHGIDGTIIVHHINPVTLDDVKGLAPALTDLENLISVSTDTHNKIHYAKSKQDVYVERKPNDTKLW